MMRRLTQNKRYENDPALKAEYEARVKSVDERLTALKRGAQNQMARDIPTSPNLLSQVRQGKRMSVVTLEAMEAWLEAHEQEWQEASDPAHAG